MSPRRRELVEADQRAGQVHKTEPQRVELCHLVGKPTAAGLAQADDELHTALGELEAHLARGADGEVRLTDDGGLVIPPLTAEDIPAEADALRTGLAGLAGLLPRVPLASVSVELDARTGSPTSSSTPAGR